MNKILVCVISAAFILFGANALAQTAGSAKSGTQIKIEAVDSQGMGIVEVGVEPTVVTQPVIDERYKEKANGEPKIVESVPVTDGTATAKSEPEIKPAKNLNELRAAIEAKKTELQQEVGAFEAKKQKVYQNQNAVREAVHVLLQSKELLGGIGPQVSAIAKEFNNSVSSTLKIEEKIQTRNPIIKKIFGGDAKSAEELDGEVVKNRVKVEELKQLKNQCSKTCKTEVKDILQEQIQNMEQEQERLHNLAEKEKNSRGVVGWFLKWFKK